MVALASRLRAAAAASGACRRGRPWRVDRLRRKGRIEPRRGRARRTGVWRVDLQRRAGEARRLELWLGGTTGACSTDRRRPFLDGQHPARRAWAAGGGVARIIDRADAGLRLDGGGRQAAGERRAPGAGPRTLCRRPQRPRGARATVPAESSSRAARSGAGFGKARTRDSAAGYPLAARASASRAAGAWWWPGPTARTGSRVREATAPARSAHVRGVLSPAPDAATRWFPASPEVVMTSDGRAVVAVRHRSSGAVPRRPMRRASSPRRVEAFDWAAGAARPSAVATLSRGRPRPEMPTMVAHGRRGDRLDAASAARATLPVDARWTPRPGSSGRTSTTPACWICRSCLTPAPRGAVDAFYRTTQRWFTRAPERSRPLSRHVRRDAAPVQRVAAHRRRGRRTPCRGQPGPSAAPGRTCQLARPAR